jgi:hypothetical protein
MMASQKQRQAIKIFKLECETNQKRKYEANNSDILNSLFKKEKKEFVRNINPLDSHTVTTDYRTKMVDWMIEVCTSFKCADRTWFLAVTIFDKFL